MTVDRKVHSVWPGGHRAALCLSFDVDGPYGERNYQPAANTYAISQTEYEPFGVRRILGILSDFDVSATFCWVGKEADDRPDLVREAFDAGHEIALHTWDHQYYGQMSTAEQHDDLERTFATLHSITGTAPVGHKTGGWRYTDETHLLCQEMGLQWAMDIPRGDQPFLMAPNPELPPLVHLPPSAMWDDYTFFVDRMVPPSAAYEFWHDDLDVLRTEGGLMSLTFHPFVSGRPAPSRAIVRLLDYAIDLGDIWIASASEIATWWRANHSTMN